MGGVTWVSDRPQLLADWLRRSGASLLPPMATSHFDQLLELHNNNKRKSSQGATRKRTEGNELNRTVTPGVPTLTHRVLPIISSAKKPQVFLFSEKQRIYLSFTDFSRDLSRLHLPPSAAGESFVFLSVNVNGSGAS